MKGIAVRIARGLNRLLGRRGPVIDERYHLRVIRTRQQAHRSIAYVLDNLRRHVAKSGRTLPDEFVDECSSARAFQGWSRRPWKRARAAARDPCPDLPLGVHSPCSRLLSWEWRVYGPIDPAVIPGPFPERSRAGSSFQ